MLSKKVSSRAVMGNSTVHFVDKGEERVLSWPRAAPNRNQWFMELEEGRRCPERMGPLDQALRDPTLSPHGSVCEQEEVQAACQYLQPVSSYALSANIPKGRNCGPAGNSQERQVCNSWMAFKETRRGLELWPEKQGV